jgi:hypothetical protein
VLCILLATNELVKYFHFPKKHTHFKAIKNSFLNFTHGSASETAADVVQGGFHPCHPTYRPGLE